MVYKYLRAGTTWRLLIIVVLAIAIGFAIGHGADVKLISVLVVLEGFLIFKLIKYLNLVYGKINYFIEAVKNEDTSFLFSKDAGSPVLKELHQALNELNRIIQEKNIKNRMNERYFSHILHHISTAVLVFNDNEFVINANRATLNLFGLHVLTHLKQLEKIDPALRSFLLQAIHQGEKSIVIRKGRDSMQLIIKSSVIKLRDETVTLVTLQDIKGELERQELDSWLKLIKVLNHEIMNSLTPVTSIAQTLGELWQEERNLQPESKIIDQTVNGLSVIEERGEALMRFVKSYRMFTRMPELKLAEVDIGAFFDRISILISPLKEQFNADIRFIQPVNSILVRMDEQLMVQVIINLIKNGLEASVENIKPIIMVNCRELSNRVVEITVKDNGPGIPDSIKDEIFIPFFTTKPDGSGIGLSYSRQILRAHGGTIGCSSQPENSEFFVRW